MFAIMMVFFAAVQLPDTEVATIRERSINAKTASIESAKQRLTDAQRSLRMPIRSGSSEDKKKIVIQRKNNVEAAKKELDSLSKGDGIYFGDLSEPELGRIGHLPRDRFRTLQIQNETEMLAEVVYTRGFDQRVELTILIRGIPTEKLVDDQAVDCRSIFKVTDTYKFETTGGGTKKVFVFELIDEADLRKRLKADKEVKKKEAK
ncbi:MAG: hypothetical protein SGJ20_11720 [Planctomycetota bacterium]|nr:hypothetical protein [Planctomycetota bacterium]